MKTNPVKLEEFSTIYAKHLAACVEKYPSEYGFPASTVPVVAARMKTAFSNGSYNKDGRAIKLTCKELNIPHSYKGINAFLSCIS